MFTSGVTIDGLLLVSLPCAVVAIVLVALFVRLLFSPPKTGLQNIRGPPSLSYCLGNFADLETKPAGECEIKWSEAYGQSFRFDAGYGDNIFMTSDPRALQYLFQTSGYNAIKSPFILERSKQLWGENILSTEGNIHKRHRRALLPAFALPETKGLTHIFQEKAGKLVGLWKVEIEASKQGFFTTNVHGSLARAALDAIGESAFGYHFGTMDDQESRLGKVYQGVILKVVGSPSRFQIGLLNLAFRFHTFGRMIANAPIRANRSMVKTREVVRDMAGKLFDEKWSATELDDGDGRKDVMSLLARSNASEEERSRLTRAEVIDQMGAIMFAGHETTSNTLSWALWELAKNHQIQDELREEVRKHSQKHVGVEGMIPVSEYDSMEYMSAFIKEVLRFHPIIPRLPRRLAKEMVIPLSGPILDVNGKELREVHLSKGTRVMGNVVAYNRHPVLWGADPHTFRPERWFEMKEKDIKFGVYGNLASFGAGIHACIGWRFALYEIQSFLIALVLRFKFDLPEDRPKIRRTYAGVMTPQVEGQGRQASMPLKIMLI